MVSVSTSRGVDGALSLDCHATSSGHTFGPALQLVGLSVAACGSGDYNGLLPPMQQTFAGIGVRGRLAVIAGRLMTMLSSPEIHELRNVAQSILRKQSSGIEFAVHVGVAPSEIYGFQEDRNYAKTIDDLRRFCRALNFGACQQLEWKASG